MQRVCSCLLAPAPNLLSYVSLKHQLHSTSTHSPSRPASFAIRFQATLEPDFDKLTTIDWTNVTSDATIARLCFAGLAAHETAKLHAPERTMDGKHEIVFVNDFDWLYGLEV